MARKPKVTSKLTVEVNDETLMQLESLKSLFECDESAMFEIMTRKLYEEKFYMGLSPLLWTVLAKAQENPGMTWSYYIDLETGKWEKADIPSK